MGYTQYLVKQRIETNGNPPKGSSAPTQVFLNNTTGMKFSVGDEVYFNISVPENWDPSASGGFVFSCHFYSSNTTAGRYVQGQLDWQSIALGETITAPGSSGTLTTGDILLPTVANQLGEANFAAIPNSSIAAGDHIFLRLSRIASVGTAPAAGDNPVLMHFEIEYQAHGLGKLI